MKKRQEWDEQYEKVDQAVRQWRGQHKKASLTEIEETVDEELASL